LQWARALNVDKAKVIRFSGLTKIEEIDYTKPDEDADKKLLSEVTDSDCTIV
jgi:hypothetical protein